jgi:hypothetical protein
MTHASPPDRLASLEEEVAALPPGVERLKLALAQAKLSSEQHQAQEPLCRDGPLSMGEQEAR